MPDTCGKTYRGRRHSLLLAGVLLAFSPGLPAATAAPQEAEQWFEQDEPDTRHVNEGELHFLRRVPEGRMPRLDNLLLIRRSSLDDGWVAIRQCHADLDPVGALEVVYRYRQMRNLRILQTRNIGRARVEGQSVQLEDITHGASLCVELEAQILYREANGQYRLPNGPFERRFLDGFYPLHLKLRVVYPADRILFIGTTPQATPGFRVMSGPGEVHIDSRFEGRLSIELKFAPIS